MLTVIAVDAHKASILPLHVGVFCTVELGGDIVVQQRLKDSTMQIFEEGCHFLRT